MLDVENFQALLETEMSRKQFLMHIGAAILAAIGITALLKSLMSQTGNSKHQGMHPGAYSYSGYSGLPADLRKPQ